MVTRHSKHTPIPQRGARGSPPGEVRKAVTPAREIAAATVAPRGARITTPSTVITTSSDKCLLVPYAQVLPLILAESRPVPRAVQGPQSTSSHANGLAGRADGAARPDSPRILIKNEGRAPFTDQPIGCRSLGAESSNVHRARNSGGRATADSSPFLQQSARTGKLNWFHSPRFQMLSGQSRRHARWSQGRTALAPGSWTAPRPLLTCVSMSRRWMLFGMCFRDIIVSAPTGVRVLYGKAALLNEMQARQNGENSAPVAGVL